MAAAVALTTTELVGATLAPRRPSVVASVATRLVDALAGPFRNVAIRSFGTNDKAALVVGVVVMSLALGALVGVLARRRGALAWLAFAAVASLGAWASWRDPAAARAASISAAAAGAVVGSITLRRLLPRGAVPADGRPDDGRPDDELAPSAGRRGFLAAAAGTAGLALVGAMGSRQLRRRARPSRRAGALPAPSHAARVPDGQPFALDGLPPYITPADVFYRIDTAIFVPELEAATWRLTISGLVDRPLTLTYDDLLAMPLVEEVVTLACVSNDVGGHLVGNARWLGVPLRELLRPAGVHPEATQIVARAIDDFTVDVASADALDGRVAMVAVGMNGEPLPAIHGFPARLVVAGVYGYASATKWLSSLELTRRQDHESFWVERGWAKDGPIKLQSRFDAPEAGARLAPDAVRLGGMAWAPPVGVGAVEVRIDDGPWRTAQLGRVTSGNTWVHWSYTWTDATPGDHVAAVRATDGRGNPQVERPSPPEPSGATGYHYRAFSVG